MGENYVENVVYKYNVKDCAQISERGTPEQGLKIPSHIVTEGWREINGPSHGV